LSFSAVTARRNVASGKAAQRSPQIAPWLGAEQRRSLAEYQWSKSTHARRRSPWQVAPRAPTLAFHKLH
ncbi:MAG: hypothetical protein KDA61_20455, partial [Planctomycetales bacterium]|nr:hypothetical protein [Planctomycetales bacterium]